MRKLFVSVVLIFSATGCGFIFSAPKDVSLDERRSAFPVVSAPVQNRVEIFWNEQSVPFVRSVSDADGFFALGAVHAHLRLGQIELLRRISQGRISEMAGPLTIDIDHTLRIVNLGKASQGILENMKPETRLLLSRFVDGLNWYQDNIVELPFEFRALGFDKQPWTEQEIVTISRLAGVDLSWIFYIAFLRIEDSEEREEAWNEFLSIRGVSPASFRLGNVDDITTYLTDLSKSGSNSLAVSGAKTAHGAALLANDPHLGINLPNFWLIAGLHSENFRCAGFMIPGLPFFALGRNEVISWGGTNLRGISSYLFDVSNVAREQIISRKETIRVRGWRDQEVIIRESPYGPILSDSPVLKSEEEVALYWVGHQEVSDDISAFLLANRAKDFEQFRRSFESYAVSAQNMLYADREGNVGQVLAYRMPKLRDASKTLEFIKDVDLFTDETVKPTELPFGYNPEEGFIASANNRPVETAVPLSYSYASADRFLRLEELAGERELLSLEDLKAMQLDVYSPSSLRLRDLLNASLQDELLYDQIYEIAHHFRSWDGQYRSVSQGALAFEATAKELTERLFDRAELSGNMRRSALRGGYWKSLARQYFEELSEEERERVLIDSLHAASYDFDRYRYWGRIHRQIIQHPLGNVPVLGFRFRHFEYAAEGGNDTLFKSGHTLSSQPHSVTYGAQARHLSDLSDIDQNYFILLGGQDGWLNSPNLADQVLLWRRGEYLQVPLSLEGINRLFPYRTLLGPEMSTVHRAANSPIQTRAFD